MHLNAALTRCQPQNRPAMHLRLNMKLHVGPDGRPPIHNSLPSAARGTALRRGNTGPNACLAALLLTPQSHRPGDAQSSTRFSSKQGQGWIRDIKNIYIYSFGIRASVTVQYLLYLHPHIILIVR